MIKVKVTTVGNSVGIVLPREVLGKLRVQKGDTLYLQRFSPACDTAVILKPLRQRPFRPGS
jgi:putative addiction module antidote